MIVEGLATERLLFRRLTMEDVEALMEFFSDAEAMKFLGLAVGDRTVCENWVGRQLSRYAMGSGMCAVLDKSTGELLGLCGLLIQEIEDNTELEVGYHFIHRFWGKGYATEAARACRDLAFSATSLESLISIIDVGNDRSVKVAERNGMRPTVRTCWREHNVCIYRILREEWAGLYSITGRRDAHEPRGLIEYCAGLLKAQLQEYAPGG